MGKVDEIVRAVEVGETKEQGGDEGAPASPAALFGQILKASPSRPGWWPTGEPFVVACIAVQHATLRGRVQVRPIAAGDSGADRWVPTLQGLAIRPGDRLLAQMPHGGHEPIVIGVIDGFAARPEPERSVAARMEVKRDEVLQICTQEGQPLIEVIQDAHGPVVRLLQADTRIDVKGKLSITAAELELSAVKGKVRIEAAGDVDVVGEVINLN